MKFSLNRVVKLRNKNTRLQVKFELQIHKKLDCSPPDPSVHGIFQARVLEWGAIKISCLVNLIPPITLVLVFPCHGNKFTGSGDYSVAKFRRLPPTTTFIIY